MPAAELVFVHGWATDSGVWKEAARGLPPARLLIDLPGHGGSLGWDEPSLAPAVKEIAGRLNEAPGQAIGIGWSLGAQALVAAEAALRGRFKALVLVGFTPSFVEREGFAWAQPRALVRRMVMDMKKEPAPALERFYALNFTPGEAASDRARSFMRRYRYPGPISCEGAAPGCRPSFRYDEVTTALESLMATDLRGLLAEVGAPVLLVHGEADTVCPVGAARYASENIPGARLALFKGAGHAPHVTEPDRFAALLSEFMEGL